MPVMTRIKQAWNAFRSNEDIRMDYAVEVGPSSSSPPNRQRARFYNEKTIITSIYTRIAIDVAGVVIRHIQLDEQDRYIEDVDSFLNTCLTLEPNLDQGPRQFRQDIAMTLIDKGVAAIVPVDTEVEPDGETLTDILSVRVGEIVGWHPRHVKVSLYNEKRGVREEITLEKTMVAIIENPLYSVMNEPNSTLQRLLRKLTLLDAVDEQSGSGKLDLIIQLPYVIKSEARRQQAEKRREDIEFQLKDSKYGIAYTDGTEKVTQLNRPAENNMMKQIEYLTNLLYSQLGITAAVMDGTADEQTMLNYMNRTVEPILDAIREAMQRSWLGMVKTKKRQRIQYFRDPFKLVPVANLAEIADKFTRNEIVTSNEFRGFIGLKPVLDDPKADQLVNSNMPQQPAVAPGPGVAEMDAVMNQVFDQLSSDIDKMAGG